MPLCEQDCVEAVPCGPGGVAVPLGLRREPPRLSCSPRLLTDERVSRFPGQSI